MYRKRRVEFEKLLSVDTELHREALSQNTASTSNFATNLLRSIEDIIDVGVGGSIANPPPTWSKIVVLKYGITNRVLVQHMPGTRPRHYRRMITKGDSK